MTTIHLAFPDLLVVVGYFVIVLWIGFHFRNQLSAASDYFAGGHQIPWWLAGISHYMSSFSAFSFIAYAQIGYMYGWVAVTLFWATVPSCILGGLFFARRWRRARIITPVGFLEDRFNGFIRQLFAWAGIPMKVFDDALKIFATGLFVSLSVGVDLKLAILACGLVMLAYTFLGGLWALVVTDYVQFLMKVLAIVLLLPLAIIAGGGAGTAFAHLPTGFFHLSNGPYGWPYLVGFCVLILISYNASWSLAQKYYSVRNEREASKAAYCAAALNFIGAPIMLAPALIARNLMPELAAQHRTADVYVMLVLKLLPAGMIGIIIAAMFSSTMAVVSSDYNSIASVLTKDVYQRLFNRGASEGRLLLVGRVTTLVLGVITTAFSIWIALAQQQSLFNTMVTVLGLFMAPTFLPLLAGLTVRRLNWQGALAGFVIGLATGMGMLALKTWWLPHHDIPFGSGFNFEGITILANTALTVVGMAAGTWLTSGAQRANDAEQRIRVDQFFDELNRPVADGEVAPQAASGGANRAIAISTIAVGCLLGVAGVASGDASARAIDLTIGLLLCAVGILFVRKSRQPRNAPVASTVSSH